MLFIPINLKKIVFSTKKFFKTSKNSTMETSNIVADPENKELNSPNVNDQSSDMPFKQANEPLSEVIAAVVAGRSLPNELLLELCSFVPINHTPVNGNENGEKQSGKNANKNVHLLLVSNQMWSFLINRFRMECSIYSPLLKHIKKTVDAQQCDLLLSAVVAFASPQIASSTIETSSKSAKDDEKIDSIEKWMRKKIYKYHGQNQLENAMHSYLVKNRKLQQSKSNDYYYYYGRDREEYQCLFWSDRIGIAVFPFIETNCLVLPSIKYCAKQVSVFGEWAADNYEPSTNLIEFLSIILPPMNITQYNLRVPRLPERKRFYNKETKKMENIDFGKAAWLKFLLKMNEMGNLVNMVDISEPFRDIVALKDTLKHPALNCSNIDDGEEKNNNDFPNYLRVKHTYYWTKDHESILMEWLMGVYHIEAERKQAKPKKLRINSNNDGKFEEFWNSIIQEFKNAIVEGPKFSICFELCEAGLVEEYYEFKNEKTNEVLRILCIEEGYHPLCTDFPIILIVRMPAEEKWPGLEIAKKPPTAGYNAYWWKFDYATDLKNCNLLLINKEKY